MTIYTAWLIAIFLGVMSVNSGKNETNRSIALLDNERITFTWPGNVSLRTKVDQYVDVRSEIDGNFNKFLRGSNRDEARCW